MTLSFVAQRKEVIVNYLLQLPPMLLCDKNKWLLHSIKEITSDCFFLYVAKRNDCYTKMKEKIGCSLHIPLCNDPSFLLYEGREYCVNKHSSIAST